MKVFLSIAAGAVFVAVAVVVVAAASAAGATRAVRSFGRSFT